MVLARGEAGFAATGELAKLPSGVAIPRTGSRVGQRYRSAELSSNRLKGVRREVVSEGASKSGKDCRREPHIQIGVTATPTPTVTSRCPGRQEGLILRGFSRLFITGGVGSHLRTTLRELTGQICKFWLFSRSAARPDSAFMGLCGCNSRATPAGNFAAAAGNARAHCANALSECHNAARFFEY